MPAFLKGEVLSRESRFGGDVVYETVKLCFEGFTFNIDVMRPNKPGRFPAICYTTFSKVFGTMPAEWEAVCERGYVLASFAVNEIAFDRREGGGPIYDAYPDWEGKTIMAWAWGLMRIIDYLLTCDYIDPDRI